jgi:hypothetical protein
MNAEEKIQRASEDIGRCVSATLLSLQVELAEEYDLTPGQLAVAIVVAQMQMLAAGVAGILTAPTASDAQMLKKIEQIIHGIRPVIGKALEVRG